MPDPEVSERQGSSAPQNAPRDLYDESRRIYRPNGLLEDPAPRYTNVVGGYGKRGGNWCGWGHTAEGPPIDMIDQICREHDIRYERSSEYSSTPIEVDLPPEEFPEPEPRGGFPFGSGREHDAWKKRKEEWEKKDKEARLSVTAQNLAKLTADIILDRDLIWALRKGFVRKVDYDAVVQIVHDIRVARWLRENRYLMHALGSAIKAGLKTLIGLEPGVTDAYEVVKSLYLNFLTVDKLPYSAPVAPYPAEPLDRSAYFKHVIGDLETYGTVSASILRREGQR